MNALMIGNASLNVVKETKLAYLLSNLDFHRNTQAWFPKSGLDYQYDVTWADGTVAGRYHMKAWLFDRLTHEQEIVLGRVL